MTINKEKIRSVGEDILGAGMHILSGAGGDLKTLVQQAVQRIVGDTYVSRVEYDELMKRVSMLESGKSVKAGKASESGTSKAAPKANKGASKKPAARKPSGSAARK